MLEKLCKFIFMFPKINSARQELNLVCLYIVWYFFSRPEGKENINDMINSFERKNITVTTATTRLTNANQQMNVDKKVWSSSYVGNNYNANGVPGTDSEVSWVCITGCCGMGWGGRENLGTIGNKVNPAGVRGGPVDWDFAVWRIEEWGRGKDMYLQCLTRLLGKLNDILEK